MNPPRSAKHPREPGTCAICGMLPGHDEPELEHYAWVCGICTINVGKIYVAAAPWWHADFRAPEIHHGCAVPRDPRSHPPPDD